MRIITEYPRVVVQYHMVWHLCSWTLGRKSWRQNGAEEIFENIPKMRKIQNYISRRLRKLPEWLKKLEITTNTHTTKPTYKLLKTSNNKILKTLIKKDTLKGIKVKITADFFQKMYKSVGSKVMSLNWWKEKNPMQNFIPYEKIFHNRR